MLRGQLGTSSSLTSARVAPEAARIRGPAATPVRSPARASASICLKRSATLPACRWSLRGVLPFAETLDQLAGVDAERAGDLAGPVRRTGLDSVVLVLLEQCALHRRAGGLAGHLATDHDPLPWRRGQVAAGADRLAEAAFDAGGRHLLDLRGGLQVAQVDARVAVQQRRPARAPHRGRRGPSPATSARSPSRPTPAPRRAPCSGRCRARPSASRRTCRGSARPASP